MAHKKGQGSSRNGRDSPGQHRGIKVYGSEKVVAGNILVRQVGTLVHPGTNVMNSYLGYMWWDLESDGEFMYPRIGRKVTAQQNVNIQMSDPNEATLRGNWADPEFLEKLWERNLELKHNQFADFHGHGWVFRAVFKTDRKGNLLDYFGNKVTDTSAANLKKGVKGLKIGVLREAFLKEGTGNPEAIKAVEKAIGVFEKLGAEPVERPDGGSVALAFDVHAVFPLVADVRGIAQPTGLGVHEGKLAELRHPRFEHAAIGPDHVLRFAVLLDGHEIVPVSGFPIEGKFAPLDQDPVLMAAAMRKGVEAGRQAFLAGRIDRKRFASASSPTDGVARTPEPTRA